MGTQKAVDKTALRELEAALRDLADAARRRAEATIGSRDQREAIADLRRAAERIRTWRRPRVGGPTTDAIVGRSLVLGRREDHAA